MISSSAQPINAPMQQAGNIPKMHHDKSDLKKKNLLFENVFINVVQTDATNFLINQ